MTESNNNEINYLKSANKSLLAELNLLKFHNGELLNAICYIANTIETDQDCSVNNHVIATIVMDIMNRFNMRPISHDGNQNLTQD